MTRNDEHRPSAINPDDYEYVAQEVMKIEGLGDCEALLWERKVFNDHQARTGGNWSGHEHGGWCMVCGSVNAIYTIIFYHAKTNTYVRMGTDCAEKCNVGDPALFKKFRGDIKNALEAKKGVTKAKLILEEAGLSAAWPIYELSRKEGSGHFLKEEAAIADITMRLVQYGSISENQLKFIKLSLDRIATRAEREAKIAAERAAALPVPKGRIEIEGVVLKTEEREGFMPGTTVLKMVVKHKDGWVVWGSVPSGYDVDRGDTVKFKATVEPSERDPKFGFFKRPSMTEVTKKTPEVA